MNSNHPAHAAMRSLTRLVALALQDDGLRQRIKNDMRRSRVKEHKLNLKYYLTKGPGSELMDEIARESGGSYADVVALLQTVPDLEMYMPVDRDRRQWRGESDLVVASLLDDDDVPAAFNLQGMPVSLPFDPKAVPDFPVLSVVPVETQFSEGNELGAAAAADSCVDCTIEDSSLPSDAGSYIVEPCPVTDPTCQPPRDTVPTLPPPPPPSYPSGIYFDAMRIYDDNEPLLKGSPEIDIYLYGTIQGLYWNLAPEDAPEPYVVYSPNETRMLPVDCAGEAESGWRNFNFNGTGTYNEVVLFGETEHFGITEVMEWNHLVLLRRRVPTKPPYKIIIWERDDNRKCPSDLKFSEIAGSVSFSWIGGNFSVDEVKGWQSILWNLFGMNSDKVAEWTIGSFDQLEGFSGQWLTGGDADLQVRNRGFSRYNIPPYQITWYPL